MKATLEVGGVAETVVVEGAAEVIQTQSSGVSTTLNIKQISSLPLASRNMLDFVTFLPGIQTPGGNRDSIVNGLPQSSINITLDGVSVQDNYLKTGDGFFARMTPRIDAIEEVTVTTAGQGADASQPGVDADPLRDALGQQHVHAAARYYYYQSDSLDTNTYFNKVRNLPKGERAQAAGLPRRRPGRDSRPVRRPQQGVLLRELRREPVAEHDHHELEPADQRGAGRASSATGRSR